VNLLISVFESSWHIMLDAAPFMLFGFLVAGLMRAFVPSSLVARHLGKGPGSVFKAAVLGAPLPLCSCSVLPAAAGLRQQGASKGATTSFLVATPETGVDSIAASYAMLDPFMTVLRPFAAVFTAVLAGIGVNILDREKQTAQPDSQPAAQAAACSAGCGCSEAPPAGGAQPGFGTKLKGGVSHAFGEMLADIGGWFLAGVLLAGVITALLPDDALGSWLGSGPWPMLAALVVAVPLYVCATATTPLAAALVLKGLSPGAALVLLLAGPATNAATLTVVTKLLGRRAAGAYLASIVVAALGLGALTNWIYTGFGLSTAGWLAGGLQETLGPLSTISAVALLLLIPLAMWRSRSKHGTGTHSHDTGAAATKHGSCCGH